MVLLCSRILGSNEALSTDDEDTEEDDSDFDEMGKNLENMLSNKKTSHQVITKSNICQNSNTCMSILHILWGTLL